MKRSRKLAWTAVGLSMMSGTGVLASAEDRTPTAMLDTNIVSSASEAESAGEVEATPSQNPYAAKLAVPKPAPKPYRDPFYKNDFSYLDTPDYVSCDFFDSLKRIDVAPCATLDIGGEYRMRYHDEQNMARSRLNGEDNEFLLQGDVFTPDVIDTWVKYKREKEIDAVNLRPHPYEFHLYYDI